MKTVHCITPNENKILNSVEIQEKRIYLESTPVELNIELTGRCNINPPCVFCIDRHQGKQYPPLDLMSVIKKRGRFFHQASLIRDCSVGEPLSHKDFVTLAKILNNAGQKFTITTNGLLLNKKIANHLVEFGQNFSMGISIHASTKETYKRLTGNNFDKLIENIRYYTQKYREKYGDASKPDLVLNFIVMKLNKHEIQDFIHFGYSLGVAGVNFDLLRPLPVNNLLRSDFGYKFYYNREILFREDVQELNELIFDLGKKLNIVASVNWESDSGSIGCHTEESIDIPCLFPWQTLSLLDHNNASTLCCFLPKSMGNWLEIDIDQIWNGDILVNMRNELRNGKVPSICQSFSLGCPLVKKMTSNE